MAEARRISHAYLYAPFMAVHSSAIQPLPHQTAAVYEKMLPRHPLRYVLADAGKTIRVDSKQSVHLIPLD